MTTGATGKWPVSRRLKVLFVAEAVTLAHIARPAALLGCLNPEWFDAAFACDVRGRRFVKVNPDQYHPIRSIDSVRFSDRLDRGTPVYEANELTDYVHADLALIEKVRPDVVIGDFRLSLSVSARLMAVPYACITNGYWSPYSRQLSLPLPVLPWTPYVPLALAQGAFDLGQPWVLTSHCRPLNTVRTAFGLRRIKGGLRSIYTDADHVLYADAPSLFPLDNLPRNHHQLGPIPWSPPVDLPAWWNDLPTNRPLLYVTMGSSGSPQTLELVLDSLSDLDVSVIAATVGAPVTEGRGPKLWCADYLPGEQAAARASVVICNGGSPTSQQALAVGRPVIGICRNMDQMLNMRGLVDALSSDVLGISLRSDRLTKPKIRNAVTKALAFDRGSSSNTAGLNTGWEPDLALRFQQVLAEMTSSKPD